MKKIKINKLSVKSKTRNDLVYILKLIQKNLKYKNKFFINLKESLLF